MQMFFIMFVRRKKNRSGSVSVVVAEKYMGRIKELITIGIAKSDEDVVRFSHEGHVWMAKEQNRRHPKLSLFDD